MLVTNKLLIPCRVLDSHFCRLSNSTLPLMPPPRPPPHGSLPLPVPSPFLNPRVSFLSHCRPTPTASSNVYPLFLRPLLPLLPLPPPLPPGRPSCSAPRLASATHPLNDRHPTLRRHFLGFSHSPRALLSCFALIQKPTWAVCLYRCA